MMFRRNRGTISKNCTTPMTCGKKWKELFLSVCDKHAPVKTKRTRPTKSPWITTNLKKRMNFRNRLKKKAVKTKDASSWNRSRKVKNKVNQEIKAAKEAYYNNSFNNYAGDQRKTWKTINELTSRKSNKTIINEIQYQGLKSSNQAEVAELLNTFFIEIGPRLSRNVSNVDTTYKEFLCGTSKEATGLDSISAKLLRECPDLIAESLTLIFNQSLLTGIFPDEWKSARVTPLYKNSGK